MERQPSSRMCFCCGRDNPIGLHLKFDFDGERVWTQFTPQEYHQGYPGILHGGIIFSILDEVIGRVCLAHGVWMVTAKSEIRFRQPVPLDQTLTAVGAIKQRKGRILVAQGELRLADGSVGAEAEFTYVEAPGDIVERWQAEQTYWKVDEEASPM
ncbi:MAG: PaaI family thioesterase [Anaerolineae bacterium]